MLQFSGNKQNIKIVRSPPEHFAIGYVHNDNLPLGNVALQHAISKQLQGGLTVFSDDFLHFLKFKKNFAVFTKTILWLLKLAWTLQTLPILLKFRTWLHRTIDRAPFHKTWTRFQTWNNWYKLLKSWVVIGCQQITAILLLISCFMKQGPRYFILCLWQSFCLHLKLRNSWSKNLHMNEHFYWAVSYY